jgi:uncharacterized protein
LVNTRKQKKLSRRLVEAAGSGHADMVAALVRLAADPNKPDSNGSTALYRASVHGSSDTVRLLMEAGARPDTESGRGDEGLPLCAAAAWGHEEVVRELLAGGADVTLREDHGQGRTALEWAIAGGHSTSEALLRAAHASTKLSWVHPEISLPPGVYGSSIL